MSNQLFTDGSVINHEGTELECVLVQYRDVNDTNGAPTGEKENFVYGFRLKSEMDAEREEQRKIEEDQAKAREENANAPGQAAPQEGEQA